MRPKTQDQLVSPTGHRGEHPGTDQGGAEPPVARREPQSPACLEGIIRSNRRGPGPYARWCGRGGAARLPLIPINGVALGRWGPGCRRLWSTERAPTSRGRGSREPALAPSPLRNGRDTAGLWNSTAPWRHFSSFGPHALRCWPPTTVLLAVAVSARAFTTVPCGKRARCPTGFRHHCLPW